MRKNFINAYDRLQKKHRRLKISFVCTVVFCVILLFGIIYINYDYILFKNLIAHTYSHTEALDELFQTHLGFAPANYARYFDNLVISIVTAEIRRTANDIYTYQYSPNQRIAQREGVIARAQLSRIEEISPDTVYMHLTNSSPYVRNFVRANIDTLASFDNLILDLRGNLGGYLNAIEYIASLFLQPRDTIGYNTTRINLLSQQRSASRGQPLSFDNIIILQNGQTASAAEILILALKENLDNVTTVGSQTFGKGVGQVTLPLRRGFAVRATTILFESPLGNIIHNIGIAPDIEFFGDDIIDFAIDIIGA